MKEIFNGYILTALPRKGRNNRWEVSVKIQQPGTDVSSAKIFHADDRIGYILRVEAEKEAINLGKNLIKKNIY